MRQTKLNEIVKMKKEKTKKNRKRNFILLLILMVSISIGAQTLHKISYYSGKFNGRHTTNGERYSSKRYTCAHRTYKFGTLLKIRNPKNGKEVVVVVNDRGPHVKGIYLDISYIAAKELGIIKQGIAKVEVTVIDSTESYLVLKTDTVKNDSIL